MIIRTFARNFSVSDAIRDHSETKIRLALGLYSDKIKQVDVVLKDVNGPKGGEDKRCKIVAHADGLGTLTAEETSLDMYAAISICAQKIRRGASRRFDRALQRNRLISRASLSKIDPKTLSPDGSQPNKY